MNTQLRKLILGFCFTLFCISLNAQNYEYIPIVKPGVQIWTCDNGYYGEDDYSFKRYALTDEDTIIENETYKKLYFFTNSDFNPSTAQYIGGLRENEKQVFYKGYTSSQSRLICDFSLSVGDTFGGSDPNFTFEVKYIDTINYEGIQRRVFTIGIFGDLMMPPQTIAVWIEGIGNYEGLLFDMDIHTTTAHVWGLNRCYEHNGVLLYHNYSQGIEDCITPLVGLNDTEKQDNNIILYPNPAISDIKISSESTINSIEVFNSLGQKIYQENVKAKEKIIDINSFSKGNYIIGVSTDKGYINKKLIKN